MEYKFAIGTMVAEIKCNGKVLHTIREFISENFSKEFRKAYPNFFIYAEEEKEIFADAKMYGNSYSIHAKFIPA